MLPPMTRTRSERQRSIVRALVALGGIAAIAYAVRSVFHAPPQSVHVGPETTTPEPPNDDPEITTRNGLISVRYPHGFTATPLDNATLELDDEALSLTIGAVMNPMTEDPSELAERDLKILRTKLAGEGATFEGRSKKQGLCLHKFPGIETEETVSVPGARPTELHGCFFVSAHVAGFITYLVPTAERKREQPALDRILASVTIHPLAVPNWDGGLVATRLPNGLLVVHHPSFYAVKIEDDHTIGLHAPDRTDLAFSATKIGATRTENDVETAWWASVAKTTEGLVYREASRGPSTCFGNHPGTAGRGTVVRGELPVFELRSCFFVERGRAYGTSLSFPVGQDGAERALERIVGATEIVAD